MAGCIRLEAKVGVGLHQLSHSGWRASVRRLWPSLAQAFAEDHQLDDGDPNEVDNDLPKLNEAQH